MSEEERKAETTARIPPWAAWRWLENLLRGDESELSREELINELLSIHEVISNGVRQERDAYFRLVDVTQDMIGFASTGDSAALLRSGRVLRELEEDARRHLVQETEDNVPAHWNIKAEGEDVT